MKKVVLRYEVSEEMDLWNLELERDIGVNVVVILDKKGKE